jgi:hypothetical protein
VALYSIGFRTAGTLAALEIYTGPDTARLLEFAFMGVFNSNPEYGIGRPVIQGSGRGVGLFQPHDPNDPVCTVAAATTWASPPTSPAVFLRRARLDNGANSVGKGFIWAWEDGLIIPPNSSVVFYSTNPTVATTWDGHAVIDV